MPKMGRKRKIAIVDEEKENDSSATRSSYNQSSATSSSTTLHHGPMYTIMSNVQINETFHRKYIKEMQQLYTKMDHDAFMFTFLKMIKSAMEADEGNDYAYTTLIFCAKFVSSFDGEDTHQILVDTCKWLLTTISHNPHIRFRLCQFVNMILNALGAEAALDDVICDHIMEYMLARLRDIAPSVRVQAILALQRLQVPDNPDDPVLRAYQFHLCSDPSPRVRQAVITSMGRNYNTIPYILDRLWDIDEKVRRHTYLHMSSYPVKSYKVSQRLTLLEQGLNDRSDMVRKVVITIMLQQWIESYQKNLILLVSGLKLDSNDAEIDRFRKITKLTLKEIFKRQSNADLIACIPLEEDCEFHKCVPHEKLTIEISLYWQCLTEYFQAEMADELDLVVPELSTFCAYVERYCQMQKDTMDKFEQMDFQYVLLSLMEILYTFDLGDEIGRENLKKLLTTILKFYTLDEKIINVIVKCTENLITNPNTRLQYFVEIIQEICDLNTKHNDLVHDRNLINELMGKSSDAALNLKLSSLKVKILDLEEQEMNYVKMKDYVNAQKITEKKNACSEEYSELLKPLLEQHSSSESISIQHTKKITNESILKSLQVAFYMVVSKKVQTLTPNVCKLYNEFICRHIASNQIVIRDWALKCGTAYSMLYESLAKDVFEELYSQFYKNHNIRIWKTAISCIFELLDRYGMEYLVVQEQPLKAKKSGRQLYNTLEILDNEEEPGPSAATQGVDIIFMMSHFLDTCDDVCIMSAIITGFCRLVLRGHIKSGDIIEKLLLRYFNPATDNEINQILGVFLENLIQLKKQDLIYPCLLPTVSTVLSAPYDSPLQEIKPETIMRFVIDATCQKFCSMDANVHNKLAELFLQEMQNNVDNKELCKLLAKEIITLEINVRDNQTLKKEMKDSAEKIISSDFDPKTIKNIIDFKDMLDGVFNPPQVIVNAAADEDEEDKSDEELSAASEKRKSTEQRERTQIDKQRIESQPDGSNCIQSVEPLLNNADLNRKSVEKARTPSPVKEIDAISPSAAAPTTYGRENTVGLRYLRKSLNMSRNNSISESGDGPTQSPKIRIEARIDSDKKVAPPNQQKKALSQNSRARRNLRRFYSGGDEAPAITPPHLRRNSKGAGDSTQKKSHKSHSKSPKADKQKTLEKTKASSNKLKNDEKSAILSRLRRKRGTKTNVQSIENPPEINNSIERVLPVIEAEDLNHSDVIPPSPTAVDTRRNTSRSHGIPTEDLNHSDVIPPSPTAVDTRRNTSRSQGIPTEKYIGMRVTRSNKKASIATDMSSPKKNSLNSSPLRNGRKRVLHPSPKELNGLSPLRKQLKVDKSHTLPVLSPSSHSLKAVQWRRLSNATPKSSSITGISSLKKDTEMAVEKNSLKSNVNDNEQMVLSISDSSSNVTPMTPSSNGYTEKAAKRLGRDLLQKISNSGGISTRHSARKERQSNMIMTRNRLSLENPIASSSASSIRSLSPARVPANAAASKWFKLKAPSKIPVRRGRTYKVESSGMSVTTAASSEAESMSTKAQLAPTRRKEIATKAAGSNLRCSNSALPVPVRLTRIKRSQIINKDMSAGKKYADRRQI